MNSNKETYKYPKYLIKKFAGPGSDLIVVAKFWTDELGKLLYTIEVPDEVVEQVLSNAQCEGGLHMNVPFSNHKGEVTIRGLKKYFAKVTDADYFIDAIVFNLKGGLVEIEE